MCVSGLRMCKKILSTKSFQRYGTKPLDTLMPGCEEYSHSDEDYLRCYTRHTFYTCFHGVGTAKMGDPSDPTTVVDPELRYVS